ncbi:hypothetical protein [Micromonospora sp. WMMD1082]|nr:hypothetical protein [Micromonospora sp. WMMD1082]MDG4796895.1 hypothetical protein [Micromonospora sp. WMMD1082]
MSRRRRIDEQVRIAVEVHAPRWAVRAVTAGVLLLGAANVTAVVMLLVAG